MILPGQLVELVAEDRHALTKVPRVDGNFYLVGSALQSPNSDPRLSLQPGALVEEAVVELQALGEGFGVVRIGLDDFIAVDGGLLRAGKLAGHRDYPPKKARTLSAT